MLVKGGAVEPGQPVGVLGEVARHPIDDHPDARLVAPVDEVHEVVRRAEAGGGSEVADHLVAPAPAERVLHDGQQLDVGVAHLGDVGHQRVGQLPVGEPAVVRPAHPGAEVDLVNRNRLLQPVGLGPAGQPLAVVPLVFADVPDHRGRLRRHLGGEGVRVGLHLLVAAEPRADVVLVRHPLADLRDEYLPDAAVALAHRVPPCIPVVEVTDDAHRRRVRGPDGEADAPDAFHLHQVRAEGLVGLVERPLAVQMQLEVGEQRPEAVRVFLLDGRTVMAGDAQPVGARVAIEAGGEDALGMHALHRETPPRGDHFHCGGVGQEGPHLPSGVLPSAVHCVRAENAERIAVVAADEGLDFLAGHRIESSQPAARAGCKPLLSQGWSA